MVAICDSVVTRLLKNFQIPKSFAVAAAIFVVPITGIYPKGI